MATRKNSIIGVFILMKYVVEYQRAFGIPDKKEQVFDDESEAKWFERAMKRTNFITKLTEVEE